MEGKNINIPDVKRRNPLIDFRGNDTGLALNVKRIIGIVIAIAAPFLCSLLPLASYGEKAGLALGIVLSTMALLICDVLSPGATGALFCFVSILCGIMDLSALQDYVGNGLFFQVIGLCMVGYGIESTPFGSRLAYLVLYKLGSKPKRIVVAILVVTAVLSSVISNFATVALMTTLIHAMMNEMGELPGKSRFGAACMLATVAGANIGGMGFINGSIGVNLMAIGQINAGTTGDYNITPAQWAMVGWTILIPLLVVVSFVLLHTIKFDPSSVNLLSKEFYKGKLDELGRIGGSEIRWLLTIIALLAFLLMGLNANILMLIFIPLVMAPCVGIMKSRDAFAKGVPWEVMFCMTTLGMLGTIFNNNGLADWIADLVAPLISGFSPFVIMLLLTTLAGLLANLLVGGTYANITICVAVVAPILESLGLNPSIMLMPSIILISFMFSLAPHATVFVNYVYGYYTQKDLLVNGLLITAAGIIISCLVCYFLAPLYWGTSIYI